MLVGALEQRVAHPVFDAQALAKEDDRVELALVARVAVRGFVADTGAKAARASIGTPRQQAMQGEDRCASTDTHVARKYAQLGWQRDSAKPA